MESKDQINAYTCRDCGHTTVTANLADGVTPMFIRCRRDPILNPCDGNASSHVYHRTSAMSPTYGWYAPTAKERSHLDPATREHVEQGGLLLRKLDNIELEQFGHRVRQG